MACGVRNWNVFRVTLSWDKELAFHVAQLLAGACASWASCPEWDPGQSVLRSAVRPE